MHWKIFSNITDLYPLDVSTPTSHGNENFYRRCQLFPGGQKSPRIVPHLRSGWLIAHWLEIPLHIYLLWCTLRMFWCHKKNTHSNTYPCTFQFVSISDLEYNFLEVRILVQRLCILSVDSLRLLSQVAPVFSSEVMVPSNWAIIWEEWEERVSCSENSCFLPHPSAELSNTDAM